MHFKNTFLKNASILSTHLVLCVHTANVRISFIPQLCTRGHTSNNHDTIGQHVVCCITGCPQLYNLLVIYLNTRTAGNTRNCKLKKIRHRSIKNNMQVFTIFPKSQDKVNGQLMNSCKLKYLEKMTSDLRLVITRTILCKGNWLIDLRWVRAFTVLMHRGLIDGPLCPVISYQLRRALSLHQSSRWPPDLKS